MTKPVPGVITTIAAQPKTRKHLGERANVFIDGKFSFALDVSLIEKHDLRRGKNINADFLSRLLQEDGDAKARARALHFLSYRPRSQKEIRDRLKRDEWPEEVIDRVLAQLGQEGHVSDINFSDAWVAHRTLSNKPRGARVLRAELRQKGVARETIDESLPLPEEEGENAIVACRQLLRSKERAWRDLDEREKRDKTLQAMARRGFDYSTARAAWNHCLAEDETT